MTTARAVVQTGPRALEMREFPLPEIGADDALLRIEACGICGSDYEQYTGQIRAPFPVVPGHEPVGRIAGIGPQAKRRWGVSEGDLVAIEPAMRCGRCAGCQRGGRCRVAPGAYGYTPVATAPSLWGGYAEHLYLDPCTVVHPVRKDVPARRLALYNALGSGFAWAQQAPDLRPGQSIAILGPGQRGLASVIAARETGAGPIIVTGLARDAHKLALARELGADVTVTVESEDAVERVREATAGRGVDVALDVSAYATQPVMDALRMTRPGGKVVLAGVKGSHRIPEFPSDQIIFRQLTVIGVLGVDYAAFEKAIRVIESDRYPLEKLASHTFALEDAARAIETLSGEAGEPAICVALDPSL